MFQDWLSRLQDFWNASRRNQIIVAASCAVVIALLVASIASFANRGGASATSIAGATATPQQTPTPAGTPQPTPTIGPTATPLPTKPVDQAIIGGTEAGFTAAYGKPISSGVDQGNNLPTVTYKGSGLFGSISIELDSTRSYVVGIVISPPKNTPWDANAVKALYPRFAPSDTTYDQAQSITNQANQNVAIYSLGHSPLLASSLPENAFTDYQNQAVSSGTFTFEIYYLTGTNGQLAYACSFHLGNWPTSPAG